MEIKIMNAQTQALSARGSVLLLSTDGALFEAMVPHFAGFGLALEVFDTPVQLSRRVLADGSPGGGGPPSLLVLVDLDGFPHADAFASLDADGHADQPARPPLVCLGQAENLRQRLESLRVGAAAWLPRDLDAADLAAQAAALAGPADGTPERVLVVDDQLLSALFAARVLEQAGMVTQKVLDPLLALPAMDRFAPDLVVMDLHMPGASGIELTALIREQARYADLPILFLSVELDPARQLDALRVGGDDFLAKPVPPQRLVACVRQRLARARHQAQLRKVATAPAPAGPTGLVDRERLLAQLDRLIHSRAGDWGLIYLEQAGDAAALHQLAVAASARAGAAALAARVGEHGVAVLVRPGAARPFDAFAEDLGQGVRADLQAGAAGATPTFGVGWCAVPAGGGESLTLVSRARQAARISLHRRQGRAEGHVKANGGPHTVAAPHPVLEAITASQFQLLFQPMVPLRGAAAPCYEATLRLAMPDGELLAPGAFASVALQAGQAPHIDRWLLAAGLNALRECRTAGRPVALFLHQSFASAADEAWVEWVRDAILARSLVQFRPVIQLQLDEVDRQLELAVHRAGQLATLGIRLCLNAVTEGESSLRVLERLPVSYVRFARSADWRLPAERLRALVHRTHARRARVIVTGVAGPEAIAPLHRAGVDLIQGPYIQPPGEAMDFDFADGQG